MNHQNPYASPGTTSCLSEQGPKSRSKKLWIGYLIAPAVAPAAAAAAIFFGAEYLIDPDDMGTPIGIIVVPILLLTVGMVLSYVVMLVIGMPIAFFLEHRGILNGYTIHLAAIAVSVISGMIPVMISIYQWLLGAAPPRSFNELLRGISFTSLGIGLLVLPTATVFWLVVCKLGSHSPHTDRPES